jgi:hypothetical protein
MKEIGFAKVVDDGGWRLGKLGICLGTLDIWFMDRGKYQKEMFISKEAFGEDKRLKLQWFHSLLLF